MIMDVTSLCTLLILWLDGKQVAARDMQIGGIVAITEYAMPVPIYLVTGVVIFAMVPRTQACVQRIDAIFDTKSEISDNIAPGKVMKLEDPVSHGKMELRNVTFRYEHVGEDVLHGTSFSIRKSQTTAAIGGTGSGESIIASLLMRSYDI